MAFNNQPPLHALVAYVRNALGEFIEDLRAEVHPPHAHIPSHLSILPPRPLCSSEQEALGRLRQTCANIPPFDVQMGDVDTFLPTTPTVFIRVAHAAYKLRELHDALNCDGLHYHEPLIYMPHLTIAKLDSDEQAKAVLEISARRWSEYQGNRIVRVQDLSFVRGSGWDWTDVATVPLTGIKK